MIERVAEVVQQLRFWGPGGVIRALQFALLGEWGRMRARITQALQARVAFEPVGRLAQVESLPAGGRFCFTRMALEIRFLQPDLVCVSWQVGPPPVPYAIARTSWPPVDVALRELPDGWALESEAMQVRLYRDHRLCFFDADGCLLREEFLPLWRGEAWLQRVPLRSEEHLYGLGEHAGPLNLRGSANHLWNSEPMQSYGPGQAPLYMNIPVYLGLHHEGSYLVFYENAFPATFSFNGMARAQFEGGRPQYYFIPGPPDRAYKRYTELTGRPVLPPRWALGYHQSRFSYKTAADVRAIAEGFRTHDLPLSAIHLDIHYMQGFRVFTVDRRRFPDLAGLARDLQQHDVRLVAILDPGVKRDPSFPLYCQGIEQGLFCLMTQGKVAIGPVWPGWCAFPDFSEARVREWWGQQYSVLLDAGVVGFWHDMNEPAITGAWGQRTLANTVRHSLEGRGGDHREVHNQYALLMAWAGYVSLRKQAPDRRPFILSRSGWAGLQRYAWSWTGDTQSSWDMLRQTVAMVIGLGLSGIPYTGPDVGGFKGTLSTELFLRWFQLAAFLPFFRTHSSQVMPRREPWSFGDDALAVLRKLLHLRVRLLPYFYSLAWTAHQTGAPLVRPLFWPDGSDPDLWDVADAFFLGDALLVAPVLEQDARTRALTLPAGRWYDFWDDAMLEGPGVAQVAAPLDRIPVLVRAGTVLPLAEEGRLVLHLYPPRSGMDGGQLYSDAGDGYGDWRLDQFRLTRRDDGLALTWEQTGAYPFGYPDVDIHVHGMQIRRVLVDGVAAEQAGPRLRTGIFQQILIDAVKDDE